MSCRRVLGSALLSSSFALAAGATAGCDLLKHNDAADAAAVAPAATPAVPATPVTPATPAPPVTTVAPLGGAVVPAHGGGGAGGKPSSDGGKPSDAGVAAADGGTTPPPAPTPTFTIPTSIPGFDAGAFKPPPGFPSTIPTFPQPGR